MPLLTAPSLITRKVAGINANQQKSDSDMKFNTRVQFKAICGLQLEKISDSYLTRHASLENAVIYFYIGCGYHHLRVDYTFHVRESSLGSE